MLSQERLSLAQECQRAWVEVDLNALAENTRQIKRFLQAPTELMAVVKADAYGHGASLVTPTLLQNGVNWLGVATVPEGIELRQHGIEAPILVLGAVNSPCFVRSMAQWNLQPTLSSPKQALIFSRHLDETGGPLPVHLMLDTGMARLGCPWEHGLEFIQFVRGLPNLHIASIYSHFAAADDLDPSLMECQHRQFQSVIQELQAQGIPMPRLHLANSAATLRDGSVHYDLVRVGLALYGLYPAPHLQEQIKLRPVLHVRARITLIKQLEIGAGVSYGHQFVAKKPMRIAVVGIGYADGIPRRLSNQMTVIVNGCRVQQIGAITMDQLMIDISELPELQEGDVVTLLGEDGEAAITADDWAETLGTISWEILCGFKHRLPRIPVD